MRVACDNCGASYKIPDTKLTKEVNKATCRKCGHAMYIRRPGAPEPEIPSVEVSASDERTVITNPHDQAAAAVESTETGAPPPAWTAPPAPNHGDLAESTIPRDVPAAPTPFPPPPVPPRAPAPAGPSPASSAMPVVPPPRWEPMALGPAVPSTPVTSDLAQGRSVGNAPGVDARSDLGLALFGTVLAVIGTGVGAIGGGSGMAGTAGVFLALLGSLTALLVLVTGDRGARAASWGISLVGAVGIAVVGAVGASVVGPAERPVAQNTPQVPVAQAPAEVAPPVEAAPVEAPEAATRPVIESTRPESIRVNTSSPRESTPREARESSRPSASERTQVAAERPAPVERTEPAPKPKPEPVPEKKSSTSTSAASSSSGAAATLPLAVIDTMIKSNKAVKSCFIQEKKATGEIPSGVKVKLVIQPSGKVSSAGLTGGDWAGTDFDTCVSGAVRGISFPPFEGDPVKMTYPFVTG